MATPRVTDYMVFAAHDYIEWPCKNDYPQRACGQLAAPLRVEPTSNQTLPNDKRRRPTVAMKRKPSPPWLSEMEQSAGWSRLVCSRQWRVKEITPGLCQQPWPCSPEHNEGGHAWPAGEKEGG